MDKSIIGKWYQFQIGTSIESGYIFHITDYCIYYLTDRGMPTDWKDWRIEALILHGLPNYFIKQFNCGVVNIFNLKNETDPFYEI